MNRNLVYVRSVVGFSPRKEIISRRERERGHFVSQFVRDNRFRDVGNLVGERGVCPPKKDGR